jgi:hypothetical protein
MNEVSYAVFLITLGIAAQNPTPPDQAKERERLRQSAARSAPVKILSPLVPAHAIRTLQPPLKKMD